MKFSQALVPFALVSSFAAPAAAQSGSPVVNGSFEADANNAQPSGWMTTGGLSYVTNVPDGLFPTSGSKYLVVDVTDGIGPTLPGHGPHCWNCGGQVRQYVVRPAGERCFLSLDWDFLPTEDAYPGFYNDFLSIDVVHGVTEALIANVVYIDTGMTAGAIPYTNVPGAAGGQITWVPPQSTVFPGTTATAAPAGPKRAVVDLSAVPVGTSMRIDVFVGNVGDSYIPSKAYVDDVVLSGGKPNFDGGAAALRVLGSAHADGTFADGDWSDDALSGAPYVFRAAPGQHLSFRARGEAGLAWAMILAAPLDMGVPTAFGQINVDVFSAPFLFLANGFPGGGGGVFPGALGAATEWFSLDVPEGMPLGARFAVQAAMEQIGGGLAVTAATVVEVNAPQTPVGAADVGGGAISDDGSTLQAFAAFGGGAWPFYGVPRTSVHVNSNGSLTFGGGDAAGTETAAGMLTGPARIAAAWDDLFPPDLGQVRTTQTAKTFTASWTHVREAPAGLRGNHFAIQLYQQNTQSLTPGGVFTVYFGASTLSDGLVGVSPGGLPAPAVGAPSGNVDWTSLAASFGARGTIAPGAAAFEKFATNDDGTPRDTFDLMSIGGVRSLTFVPDGAGGYTYFVGSR